jgi:putative peptidoglycan lipid II flippase
VPDATKQLGVWEGLARTPGLHLALGIASALASYLNLGLLWRWLKRDGVYEAQPGWGRFLVRLGLSCAALCVVVGLGLHAGPDFTTAPVPERLAWLFGLVGVGGAAYAAVLVAMGWRLRELREH